MDVMSIESCVQAGKHPRVDDIVSARNNALFGKRPPPKQAIPQSPCFCCYVTIPRRRPTLIIPSPGIKHLFVKEESEREKCCSAILSPSLRQSQCNVQHPRAIPTTVSLPCMLDAPSAANDHALEAPADIGSLQWLDHTAMLRN